MAIKGIKDSLAGAASVAAKGVKAVSEKAADAGGAIVDVAAAAGEAVADKAREGLQLAADAQQESRRRKFTPILREQYFADDFDLPQLVVIEDEDNMKGNEECVGAMGWLVALKGKPEVLHMFNEFAETSGLTFVPPAQIGLAYIVSPVEPKRFIADNSFFREIEKEKVAELQSIALALGATYCKVEIRESRVDKKSARIKGSYSINSKEVSVTDCGDGRINCAIEKGHRVLSEGTYEGGGVPVRPQLRWFAGSKEVNHLVDAICSDGPRNCIKERTIILEDSFTTTLDVKAAAKIDAALKDIKMKREVSLEAQSLKEASREMVFTIRF